MLAVLAIRYSSKELFSQQCKLYARGGRLFVRTVVTYFGARSRVGSRFFGGRGQR